MSTEGLEGTQNKKNLGVETPNNTSETNKPLNLKKKRYQKVDINVLKARVQAVQDKENKRNITIFVSFILAVGVLVFYLSA
tara:strand:- start:1460 stop:1702 length:243 start_codon:yes stop_codon:yes gene_type:complete